MINPDNATASSQESMETGVPAPEVIGVRVQGPQLENNSGHVDLPQATPINEDIIENAVPAVLPLPASTFEIMATAQTNKRIGTYCVAIGGVLSAVLAVPVVESFVAGGNGNVKESSMSDFSGYFPLSILAGGLVGYGISKLQEGCGAIARLNAQRVDLNPGHGAGRV